MQKIIKNMPLYGKLGQAPAAARPVLVVTKDADPVAAYAAATQAPAHRWVPNPQAGLCGWCSCGWRYNDPTARTTWRQHVRAVAGLPASVVR
jgi:hypothetical protein